MKYFRTLVLFLVLVGFLFCFSPVFAGMLDIQEGCEVTGLPCTPLYDVLVAIMKFGLGILTILAIISFTFAGIRYIFAGGPEGAEKAKGWLTYTIIGLIVSLSGYIIIQLIDQLLRGQVRLY